MDKGLENEKRRFDVNENSFDSQRKPAPKNDLYIHYLLKFPFPTEHFECWILDAPNIYK